jgi:hypothetical protein
MILGDMKPGQRFVFRSEGSTKTGLVGESSADGVTVYLDVKSEGGRRVRPRLEMWHRSTRVSRCP